MRRSQPAFLVADEPDGPPELQAISFRPLADRGERIVEESAPAARSAVRALEPALAADVQSAKPIAAPDMRTGEDPAALAFAFPVPGKLAWAPRAPRTQPTRGRSAALLVAVAAAAFVVGHRAPGPSVTPEPVAPDASPSPGPAGTHRERSRRDPHRRARAGRRKATAAPRRGDSRRRVSHPPAPATRAHAAPRALATSATASAAAAGPRRRSDPPDEFGFEGHR